MIMNVARPANATGPSSTITYSYCFAEQGKKTPQLQSKGSDYMSCVLVSTAVGRNNVYLPGALHAKCLRRSLPLGIAFFFLPSLRTSIANVFGLHQSFIYFTHPGHGIKFTK